MDHWPSTYGSQYDGQSSPVSKQELMYSNWSLIIKNISRSSGSPMTTQALWAAWGSFVAELLWLAERERREHTRKILPFMCWFSHVCGISCRYTVDTETAVKRRYNVDMTIHRSLPGLILLGSLFEVPLEPHCSHGMCGCSNLWKARVSTTLTQPV